MSSPPRVPLILVGASVRAAAFSAWRGGFAPWAIDQFADADLAELCPARRLDADPARWRDALLSAPQAAWMYTGGVENHPDRVQSLGEIRPLLGNDAATLRMVRDPLRLADTLAAAGWPTLDVRSGTQPPRRGTWLRKPLGSGGGLGIRPVDPERESLKASPAVYYQRRLPSSAAVYGATYLMAAGNSLLLGVCRQFAELGDHESAGALPRFLYRGSATVDMPDERLVELRQLGGLLARRFPLRGVLGVDVARHENAWWVLEVNPRFPASAELLERAHRPSIVALHVATCATGNIPADVPTASYTARAKWIVYARHDLTWTTALTQWWRDSVSCRSAESPVLADVPTSETKIAAGHPICTLLLEGHDGDSGDDAACALRVLEQRAYATIQSKQ